MLRAGGNAFDAAVAVSAALMVVEPSGSGLLGGGMFLLHRASDGRNVVIDAREVAPEGRDARHVPRQGRQSGARPVHQHGAGCGHSRRAGGPRADAVAATAGSRWRSRCSQPSAWRAMASRCIRACEAGLRFKQAQLDEDCRGCGDLVPQWQAACRWAHACSQPQLAQTLRDPREGGASMPSTKARSPGSSCRRAEDGRHLDDGGPRGLPGARARAGGGPVPRRDDHLGAAAHLRRRRADRRH